MTYFAYLDEFGHIGPYISRTDPGYKESPVFGLAGFILPSEEVRGFSTWFFQRKCDLLAFEIERSGKHPALWEKKGASLYTVTNVTRYPELRRFTNRLFNRIEALGGFVFHVGIRKTAPPGAHNPNRLYVRVLLEAIKRIDRFCREDCDPPENFVLLLAEHEQRSALIAEASRSMYARHERCRHLIEPPFHLESHRYQTLQAADWIAGLVGRLGAIWTEPAAWPENEVFRRYFERRLNLVSCRSGIRNYGWSTRHSAHLRHITTGTGMPLFHTHVVVDWSARSKPSPVRPSKDAIWWAVARSDGSAAMVPEYARTRHEARYRLARLVGKELDAGRRVLMGFDFPFGYPAGVAEHLSGRASGPALWKWLAERIEDGEDNANNRYCVAAEMNAAYPGLGPFWGHPPGWSLPTIPSRKSARTRRDAHPAERRIADRRARGAKTVWQLAYAGSVGSQMLLGLPALTRLLADPLIRERGAVWPFDTGLGVPDAPLVIAEVYPSLLRREVAARQRSDEILDRAQVRVNAEAFARLDAGGGLAPLLAGSPSLTRAERRLVETEEAWILGLGHQEALRSALAAP